MFFTNEDPRAIIKGSRDPLGTQSIQQHFGRNVVSNLTTQSDSVRGFSIVLLGRYFAQRFIEDGFTSENSAVDVFLRTEQIAAYARHISQDVGGDIRGIERVRERSERSKALPISVLARGQIMSNQRLYGLWGLYSVPARTSGLINEGLVGLTSEAYKFVEDFYIKRLSLDVDLLKDALLKDGTVKANESNYVFNSFCELLTEQLDEGEVNFFGEYLRDAKHVDRAIAGSKVQSDLAALMAAEIDSQLSLGQLVIVLRDRASNDLRANLDKIVRTEAVLAPLALLFDYLISRDGHRLKEIASQLDDRWGKDIPTIDPSKNSDIVIDIKSKVYPDTTEYQHFDGCQRSLRDGKFQHVIEQLIEWNGIVQERRGGSSWIEIGRNGRLDVRFRGREPVLPDREGLSGLWRNTYFLAALRKVVATLAGKTA